MIGLALAAALLLVGCETTMGMKDGGRYFNIKIADGFCLAGRLAQAGPGAEVGHCGNPDQTVVINTREVVLNPPPPDPEPELEVDP